jgi:hypothetical protein
VWDPYDEKWEKGFRHLQDFVNEHKHCRVLRSHVTADGYPLGRWVVHQREKKDRLLPEQRARLDALGFEWDGRAAQVEVGFGYLENFVKENKHCKVQSSYVTEDGFQLGAWVNSRRREKDTMPADRKARLDALGFVWASQVNVRRPAAE